MIKLSSIISLCLLLVACEQSTEVSARQKEQQYQKTTAIEPKRSSTMVAPLATPIGEKQMVVKKVEIPVTEFLQADWTDLLPEDDLNALLKPPSYLEDIVDGSAEDTLSNTLKNEIISADDKRYQQALTSTQVKTLVNNAPIKIPAFIVPLEFDDNQNVTQFFMVPFFGACLHLPPPPPNQTIFVDYPQGFKLESLYDAYWISGIIKTSLVENDTATAAYSMEMHTFELYTDES